MKGKTYTKEFKAMVLQEVIETNDVAQVAKRHDISTKSIYTWRKESSHKAWDVTSDSAKKTAIYTPTAQEFKDMENENGQLKRILGEKDLEIAILRDLVKKTQPGYRTKLR